MPRALWRCVVGGRHGRRRRLICAAGALAGAALLLVAWLDASVAAAGDAGAIRAAVAPAAATPPFEASGATPMPEPPPPRAALLPEPPPLPSVCIQSQGFHVDEDTECYFQWENRTLEELRRDAHGPYCWGTSDTAGTLRAGEAGHPLLFHTAALTGLPPTTPLLINSFLATQCCDAVLWFWLPAALRGHPSVANATAAIPLHQRARIVWRTLDLEREWAAVAGDFPEANASAAAGAGSWDDLRFITDWVRVLVMYSHGGVWFDIDTVFLHDARALLTVAAPSFAYRAGYSILINNAVMRIARRPEPLARYLVAEVLRRRDPRPDALGYIIDGVDLGQSPKAARLVGGGYPRRGFTYIAETLLDFFWLRFLRAETPALEAVHADIVRGAPATIVSRAWTGFFSTTFNETTTPTLAAVEAMPFLPGSIAYHWHNRYWGLPAATWPDVLNRRYARMAAEKPCLAAA